MTSMLSWIMLVITTISAVLLTYYFDLSTSLSIVVWCFWLSLSVFFIILTIQGRTILNFVKESKAELLKVVWPTREETTKITIIVMIMVTLTGLILWGIDSGMMWIIGKITHLG